jgi:hypothetical protein
MIEFLLLAIGFGVGTSIFGWWSLVPVAVVWSLLRRGAPWKAGASAATAWVALIGFTIAWGPLSRLAPRVGGVLGMPGWAFVLLSPVFAWLLAWSAARLVAISPAAPSSRRSR